MNKQRETSDEMVFTFKNWYGFGRHICGKIAVSASQCNTVQKQPNLSIFVK